MAIQTMIEAVVGEQTHLWYWLCAYAAKDDLTGTASMYSLGTVKTSMLAQVRTTNTRCQSLNLTPTASGASINRQDISEVKTS
jgi:hypothetical protein